MDRDVCDEADARKENLDGNERYSASSNSNGSFRPPTKPYSFSFAEILATFVIMLSTFSGGYLEGYTSAALPSLLHPNHSSLNTDKPNERELFDGNTSFNSIAFSTSSPVLLSNLTKESHTSFVITEEESSWVGSLLLLGAAVGSLFSSWMVRMGRRTALLYSALPRIIGWILVAAATNLLSIYFGRFMSGVSIGAVSSAAPIYISEIAHQTFRGSLSCIVLLGVNTGMLVASLFGTFLEWRSLAILGGGTVIMYFIPTFCIPQSPAWLLLAGKPTEARSALKKLRRRSYCVEEEIDQLMEVTNASKNEKCVSWSELMMERRSLLPLSVMMLVTIVNRFSGYNAIITFCTIFMRRIVPSVSEYWASVTVCLIQVSGTLGAMLLVDTWGRRKLLLLSMCLMCSSLVVMGTVAALEMPSHFDGTWLSLLATMVYIGAYSAGVGPLTWVLLGELFPLDARDRGTAIISVCNWFFAFLVTKTYFDLQSSVGVAWTCGIYSIVCLVGLVVSYFVVPETKGRSLSQVEALFSYSRGRNWLTSVKDNGTGDVALSNIVASEASPDDPSYSTFR